MSDTMHTMLAMAALQYVKQANMPGRHFYLNDEIQRLKWIRDEERLKAVLRGMYVPVAGLPFVQLLPCSMPTLSCTLSVTKDSVSRRCADLLWPCPLVHRWQLQDQRHDQL